MNATAVLPDLLQLPQTDKLWLIGELLESLPEQVAVPVTGEELAALDERVKLADDQPGNLLDAGEFRRRLHEKLQWLK